MRTINSESKGLSLFLNGVRVEVSLPSEGRACLLHVQGACAVPCFCSRLLSSGTGGPLKGIDLKAAGPELFQGGG